MRASLGFRTLVGGIVVALALLLGASTAAAEGNDDYTSQPPPSGVSHDGSGAGDSASAGSAVSAGRDATPSDDDSIWRQLPVTGSDVVGLSVIGMVLVAGGALLLTLKRRATPTT